MKNIHAIPTDKASRLIKFFTNKFHLCKEILPIHDEEQYQNIYITNDEKIKEGDWCINPKNNKVMKVGHHGHHGYSSKKIILTTDQDLIKDGVQAIDDEFLEWFVNNPSCEEVMIETFMNREYEWGDDGSSGHTNFYMRQRYKIIIPKEESKQESLSWDELIREAGSEEQLIKILKLPHIAPLVREAMKNECKK